MSPVTETNWKTRSTRKICHWTEKNKSNVHWIALKSLKKEEELNE